MLLNDNIFARVRTEPQYLMLNRILIIRLLLHPSSGVSPQQSLPDLVIDEDGQREGHGGQPPGGLQGVHPQTLVHARGVGEEGGQEGLEAETKVHEVILHTLLDQSEASISVV